MAHFRLNLFSDWIDRVFTTVGSPSDQFPEQVVYTTRCAAKDHSQHGRCNVAGWKMIRGSSSYLYFYLEREKLSFGRLENDSGQLKLFIFLQLGVTFYTPDLYLQIISSTVYSLIDTILGEPRG